MWWNQNYFKEDLLIEDLLDPKPTLVVPSPALINLLPNNTSPNKVSPNVPSSIIRDPPFSLIFNCFTNSF